MVGSLGAIVLAVAAPLVAAVMWGVLIAPKAPIVLPATAKFVLAWVVFVLAAAGLIAAGDPCLALTLIGVFALTTPRWLCWVASGDRCSQLRGATDDWVMIVSQIDLLVARPLWMVALHVPDAQLTATR